MIDLTDWNNELDKQIRNAKLQNEKSFKACKVCGDTGINLFKEMSNNMSYLCCRYCDCASGQLLRSRHITKEKKE